MISKILNKKIYVVVASTGLETSSFQAFYPAQSNTNGETYMTVKEKNFSIGAPEDWIQDIQAGFKTEDTPTQDPIVLLFQSEHYIWLRFAKREDGASLDESKTEAAPMEIDEMEEPPGELPQTSYQSNMVHAVQALDSSKEEIMGKDASVADAPRGGPQSTASSEQEELNRETP
ncbi:hypothetical protein GN958_ATG06992 [Phytophthora infestans]|uniref:Uncharacterized protein n=1 Tax=Phytophthora infestans TaxID=4787 RepID=A0A8S9USD8_PHYIN|nr:hypothetical protein GN958_ATG06992 [Phytophthora infestans]